MMKVLGVLLLLSLVQRISSNYPPKQTDYEYYEYEDHSESECTGTGPVKTKDHCQACHCNYGKVVCNKVTCEAPYLQPGCRLVNVAESCCPEMRCSTPPVTTPHYILTTEVEPEPEPETTTIKQEPRNECIGTGPVKSKEKCKTCHCEYGKIICSDVICEQPYLQPGCTMVKPSGACCAEMQCESTTLPVTTLATRPPHKVKPECTGTGPLHSDEECETCRCEYNKKICSPVTCPQTYLQPGCRLVKVRNACCPEVKCEETTTTEEPECTGSGLVDSDDPCETCHCVNQEIVCSVIPCAPLKLLPGCRSIKVPGQCCPSMKCEATTTPEPECTGSGEVESDDPCQTCRCVYQEIVCSPVKCPAPTLLPGPGCRMVPVPGQCCPTMKCECEGSGIIQSPDKCQECHCSNGRKICNRVRCPQARPNCKLVPVPGECCAKEVCETITTPEPECTGNGEVESDDPCETCRCVNQEITCSRVKCPYRSLLPGCKLVPTPGQCCPTVKCECEGNGIIQSPDKCQECRCSNGRKICNRVKCPQARPNCKLVPVPGECCAKEVCEVITTPEPECTGSGEVETDDPCETCRCVNQEVTCSRIKCPYHSLLPGCKLVPIPGQCCPTVKCECEGNGIIQSPDKCQECRCSGGRKICNRVKCPQARPNCKLVNVPGDCCPKEECECTGNGEVESDDPCETCHCSNQKIVCSHVTCPNKPLLPGCHMVPTPGQCCPTMKCECEGNGIISSPDKCQECRCSNGKKICNRVRCPQARPNCRLVNVPGECCPREECITTTTPEPECTGSGEVESDDPCETCHCVNQEIVCSRIKCPYRQLLPGCKMVPVPGQCCPIMKCEVTTTPEPDCTGSGAVESNDPCQTCRCVNQEIVCSPVKCPATTPLPGCKMIPTPGQCCPTMKCECTGNGPIVSEDKCKTCRCMYGKKTCTPMPCPQPYLQPGCKLVNEPGKCCPTVECTSTRTPECSGSGPVKSKDECEICRCVNEKIICIKSQCSPPKLRPGCKLIKNPGDCCPSMQCEPPTTTPVPPECIGSGKVDSEYECQTCHCVKGKIVCQDVQCPVLKLRPGCHTVTSPDSCCPSLKCDAPTTTTPPPECTGSGPIDSEYECETCRCVYGKIVCTEIKCPSPQMRPGCQIVQLPGECCPKLKCDLTTTTPRPVITTPSPECYGSGEIESSNDCETCRCVYGKKVCTQITCPPIKERSGCRIIHSPYECCPTLKCDLTTTTPPPECTGSGFVDSDNNCETCRCVYGKIVCTELKCPPLQLRPGCRTVQLPEDCCPSLKCGLTTTTPQPECIGNEKIPPRNKCEMCHCFYGKIHCESIRCNRTDLGPGCRLINVPGECCPDVRCVTTPPPECTGSGIVESDNECETCRCVYGQIVCTEVKCPPLQLRAGCHTVQLPEECCPFVQCDQMTTTPRPECSGSGIIRSDNECETCRCNYGKIVCTPVKCPQIYPRPGCQIVRLPYKCCPSLKCDVPTPPPPQECTGNGQVDSPDKCKVCRCMYGKLHCSPVSCPHTYTNPGCRLIHVAGQCCPQEECNNVMTTEITRPPVVTPRPRISTPDCYGNGPVKSDYPCAVCECREGVVACKDIPCPNILPRPGCRIEKKPNKCCSEMVCDHEEKECTGFGPLPSSDLCEECRCVFGKKRCQKLTCPNLQPRPNCRIVQKEGCCCPDYECANQGCIPGMPIPTRDPCEKCYCEQGNVRCEKETCRPPPHPNCKVVRRLNSCCPSYDCERTQVIPGYGK